MLPESVFRVLDGDDLAAKIGITVLIAANAAEGPRIATLSVGEVLTTSARELLLTLYRSSRTTAAILETGRALLMLVDDGAIVKIRVETAEVPDSGAESAGRLVLRGNVVSVERDEVPYARVSHGIGFELLDGEAAVRRWIDQIAGLRRVASA